MSSEVSCANCPLRRHAAFRPNEAAEIAFIERFKSRQRSVSAGASILREGERSDRLYTILSGWAFRHRSLGDGRRQILNFLLPGDFVGLQQELDHDAMHGIEALSDVTLCVFPRQRLWHLYQEFPSLAYDLTWLCAHEELIVDENLLSVGRRSAIERIGMLLIHLYKRAASVGIGGGDAIPLPIGQQHIADALGLSLVHTNKTLRRLHTLGLVELRGGTLRIGDLARLQRLADYHALPLHARPLI
ncbi:MAG: Crp/Fnr family transcriptional regulator [Rhodocyclaceae bacterium]|nr:Crp/Fnr family transcriptional regulator [Rhodocyclaceae bacterium]